MSVNLKKYNDFKKMLKSKIKSNKSSQADTSASFNPAKLIKFAYSDVETVLEMLNTSTEGLSHLQSRARQQKLGLNEIAQEKPPKWYVQLFKTPRGDRYV